MIDAYQRGVLSGAQAVQNPGTTPESIEEACEYSIEHMPDENEHFNPETQIAYLRGRIAGAYGLEEDENDTEEE